MDKSQSKRGRLPKRATVIEALGGSARNMFCRAEDLINEAAVESFFAIRLLRDLGYKDSQIKPKQSLSKLTVGRGHRREQYRPDYALLTHGTVRCVVDAKAPTEDLDRWIEQCSGYCLALNRKFPRTNPVKYFVLTNGYETRLYKWDADDPLLELGFADFSWGNAKYVHLSSLVGASSIAQSEPVGLAEEGKAFVLAKPTTEKARQLFATCHRAIWKSEGFGPTPAFMAFVKLMFVKLWADQNLRHSTETQHFFDQVSDQVTLPASHLIFSVEWIEQREAEGTVNPIDTILFANIRDQIEKDIELKNKKRIFERTERIGLRPDTIKDVVRRLQHVDMFGIDEDLNGRLFETFLNATMRGRDLGQFFTPRSVVKLITGLADLKAQRGSVSKVIDACCGSGGFLIEALTVMRNKVRANSSLTLEEKEELISKIANESIYGVDFGKDPPISKIARINMYLHGDGGSHIYYADALDKDLDTEYYSDQPELVSNIQEFADDLEAGTLFDVVMTNPPFSMTKELKNPAEERILRQYDLAKRSASSNELRPSLRSGAMFMERYLELLQLGGMLITVIDDTLLSSDVFGYLRDYIRTHYIVNGIISLPADTFKRAGSRVKTSILILRKKRRTSEAQVHWFYAFVKNIGVDDLTTKASKEDVDEARQLAEIETKAILAEYFQFLRGKKVQHVLGPERIADRFDLKYCVPLFGRYVEQWHSQGVETKPLWRCVTLVTNVVRPSEEGDKEFTLLRVSYSGVCEVDKVRKASRIKPASMYRVHAGQLLFSRIRATDGAIGVVPTEYDGALVSDTSYYVFDCESPTDAAYLWSVLRTHELRADMQSLSPGSGRYTTSWPAVGEVPIPWLSAQERKRIGKGLIETWEAEAELTRKREEALRHIEELNLESPESQDRWRASKAPQ